MTDPEQKIVEQKIRRAAAANALRKIGTIVAEDQQTEAGKVNALRWFARYGWLVLAGVVALLVYLIGAFN